MFYYYTIPEANYKGADQPARTSPQSAQSDDDLYLYCSQRHRSCFLVSRLGNDMKMALRYLCSL